MNVKNAHQRIFVSIILLIGSISLTFIGLYIFHVRTHDVSVKTNTSALITNTSTVQSAGHVYSLPDRLVIPKLSFDASVLPMGLTTAGAMESPKAYKDTGWYSLGIRPGNVGSAVIAGHLGLKEDAVFGKLHLLVAGDTFSIIDDQGTTASFVVRKVRTYDKESDSTDIFSSKEGAHLNLITCNGDWESLQATYSKRLVVFSDKI